MASTETEKIQFHWGYFYKEPKKKLAANKTLDKYLFTFISNQCHRYSFPWFPLNKDYDS